jgi:hypothetical protein
MGEVQTEHGEKLERETPCMEKITQITTLGQMVPAAKRKPGVGAGPRMDTCMGEKDKEPCNVGKITQITTPRRGLVGGGRELFGRNTMTAQALIRAFFI